MVVIAIMVVILSLAIPAFVTIGKASHLTNAGFTIQDNLRLARQMAVAQNRKVAVHFYKIKGEVGNQEEYRALRIYTTDDSQRLDDNGNPVLVALGGIKRLPSDTIMSQKVGFSTLLSSLNPDPTPATEDVPGEKGAAYKVVEFNPDGSTTLPATPTNGDKWFITVKAENDPESAAMPAKNFITVMLDPVTGRLKSFQP